MNLTVIVSLNNTTPKAIPIGIAFGVVLFNENITVKFVIGTVIIVASNYYILIREKRHLEN